MFYVCAQIRQKERILKNILHSMITVVFCLKPTITISIILANQGSALTLLSTQVAS